MQTALLPYFTQSPAYERNEYIFHDWTPPPTLPSWLLNTKMHKIHPKDHAFWPHPVAGNLENPPPVDVTHWIPIQKAWKYVEHGGQNYVAITNLLKECNNQIDENYQIENINFKAQLNI